MPRRRRAALARATRDESSSLCATRAAAFEGTTAATRARVVAHGGASDASAARSAKASRLSMSDLWLDFYEGDAGAPAGGAGTARLPAPNLLPPQGAHP